MNRDDRDKARYAQKNVTLPIELADALALKLFQERRSYQAFAIEAAARYLGLDPEPYVCTRWRGNPPGTPIANSSAKRLATMARNGSMPGRPRHTGPRVTGALPVEPPKAKADAKAEPQAPAPTPAPAKTTLRNFNSTIIV